MTHHSTILEGKVIWELVADVGGETVVTAQCTVVRGSSSELNVWAELPNSKLSSVNDEWYVNANIVATLLAVLALTASSTRLHCDTVTCLQAVDLRADYK